MTAATMIYFDTLQYVKKLEKAGVPVKQAEAMAEAQQEILSECAPVMFVDNITHQFNSIDKKLTRLEQEINVSKTDINWIKWLLAIMITGEGALIFKAFFS